MSALNDFRDIYGMRFVGLRDATNSVYGTYRVPDPEAPYPQDYVIDQDGVVRYWSWEYDPQEVIRTIDELLAAADVGDGPDEPALPSGLTLSPPVPNPSGHGMELRYALPERASVRLNVYSVSGGLVRTLVRGVRRPGEHVTTWDGRNDRGRRVASGVYFVELLTAGERRTRRAVLLR